uniref:Ig-like domain-containing protein n=1 Tax=Leptobrachium leishanense TaxID=445787 RepID=A0A8C5QWW1_9ANUR
MCLSQVSLFDMCLSVSGHSLSDMCLSQVTLSLSDMCLSVSGHSLQYYHMGVSIPGHELPEFISVGYVDGIQITRYGSDTGRSVPVAPWMKKVENPDYWEEETQNGREAEKTYELNVKISMSRFNQTGGFHSFQEMYGCELRDDGSTRGYWQFGYDGKDFLSLDTERWVYYPITDLAQVSAQRWNSPEQRAGESAKYYLETDCIDWLRKYLEYGKEELERRVRPEVKVSSRPSGSAMKLHCQVYGFHPRDVDVHWKKNGMDIPSDEAKHVLPNSDGTYQLRVSVEVTPEDGASYSCYVDHSSLDEPLSVMWDPKTDGGNTGRRVAIICCVIVMAVLTVAFAVIVWRKMNSSGKFMKPVSYSSPSSDRTYSNPEYIGKKFQEKIPADNARSRSKIYY